MSLDHLCKQPPTLRNTQMSLGTESPPPMLILRATGLFYVLSLEALRHNFSRPLLTHLSKSQTGQKERLGSLVGSFLECGKELGILNPGSCDVDTKLSDLRPFELEQWNHPQTAGRRRRGARLGFWSLAA